MKLGMQVYASAPATLYKMGIQLALRKGVQQPRRLACVRIIRGPCLLWPNGWKDQDATWKRNRPRPGHTVLDGDPPPLLQRGTAQPPQFSTHVYCGHGRPSQILLSSCMGL